MTCSLLHLYAPLIIAVSALTFCMRFLVLGAFFGGFAVLDDFFLWFCGFQYNLMPPSFELK